MISFLCVTAVSLGAGTAIAADGYDQHRLLLQRLGGGLIIVGVALAGLAFPMIV